MTGDLGERPVAATVSGRSQIRVNFPLLNFSMGEICIIQIGGIDSAGGNRMVNPKFKSIDRQGHLVKIRLDRREVFIFVLRKA